LFDTNHFHLLVRVKDAVATDGIAQSYAIGNDRRSTFLKSGTSIFVTLQQY
jgi:hypothetical protein